MVSIVDFEAIDSVIDGMIVIRMKQVTDERGTVRELFRRSAFSQVGVDITPFQQINVTQTNRGAVRGMHAESMTKLCAIVDGVAFGAWVDVRPDSETFGTVESMTLTPGTQVLVPAGVANGFQSVSETSQYVYCFDHEWEPGMPGTACTPLDPDLAIEWPIPIDRDDPALISGKDRDAPTFAQLRKAST